MTALPRAPKDLKQNIAYRKALVQRASNDPEFQQMCWARAKRDPVWYCDAWIWTYNPKQFPKNPIRPFVLWDFQEEGLKKILDAIGLHDLVFMKSRDMGATTLALVGIEHPAHFENMQTFMVVSRNEAAVDKKNDPDCMFWKLDFMYERQPTWMRPRRDRNSLSLLYHDTFSSIIGASTTGEAGRGGRKVATLLDEFAAVTRGDDYAMLAATRDATNSRLINATPKGAGGAYADTLEKYLRTHPEWVITFHWSQHPIKRKGLYRVTVDVNKPDDPPAIDIIDTEWHDANPGYKFVTSGPFFWNGELRSVWYDGECERAASPQEIAQELDMKMAESASQYFDAYVLTRLREKYACAPYCRGEVRWDGDDFKSAKFDESPNGRVLLWCNPDPGGRLPWTDLVIGCDVATGKGGDMSSNSVASIVRSSTGEKVGEFTINTMSAHEFCEYVIAMCYWANGAFLIYEHIGPGGEFTRRLRDGNLYSNIYRDDASEKGISRKKTKTLGFSPTPTKKQGILSDYRSALASGKFINHCDEALIECGQYEVLPTGEIQHSKALSAQDPNARGKNHGDRVIADALAWRAILDRGQSAIPQGAAASTISPNCALARRQARESRMQSTSSW